MAPVAKPTTPALPTGPAESNGGRGGGSGGKAAGLAARQATAQAILKWDWDHAYAPQSRSDPKPLETAAAYQALAGGDARPLLVLRECESCRGTMDAFLSRELDNEKTILLGRWFHAVKLPAEVMGETHAFRGLFPGGKPAHLFLATADGAVRVDLAGDQSQSALWSAMTKVLRQAYVKDPTQAVSGLRRVLDELDHLDSRIAETEEQLTRDRGARKLEAQLAELTAERTEAIERGAALDDLQLKTGR